MEIEDLIPKGLLNKLEQEGKSLVQTDQGWQAIPTAAIQVSTTLPFVLEYLQKIYNEVRTDGKQTGDTGKHSTET